jgi:hypothetical protein
MRRVLEFAGIEGDTDEFLAVGEENHNAAEAVRDLRDPKVRSPHTSVAHNPFPKKYLLLENGFSAQNLQKSPPKTQN